MSKSNTVILPSSNIELEHLLQSNPFVGCSQGDYNDALQAAYAAHGNTTVISVVRGKQVLCITLEQDGCSWQEILLDD